MLSVLLVAQALSWSSLAIPDIVAVPGPLLISDVDALGKCCLRGARESNGELKTPSLALIDFVACIEFNAQGVDQGERGR